MLEHQREACQNVKQLDGRDYIDSNGAVRCIVNRALLALGTKQMCHVPCCQC